MVKDRIERSANALKYALLHSDNFYRTGVIKNRNVGIVIGDFHVIDYKQTAIDVAAGKTDYNLVLIFPKGLANNYK